MRRTIPLVPLFLYAAALLCVICVISCDEKKYATSTSTPTATPPAPPSPAATSAGRDERSADAPPWDASMPPRPVPRTSPTVSSNMPAEVQMQAIAYMAAMAQPRYDDPNADPQWAAAFAERLRTITRGLDKGTAEEKEKLDRVEVVGGGRKLDLMMAAGCDAETPMRAVVTRGGQPLSTLYAHGVMVVRCNDARVQCLQSTRDSTDVLCTTAPRHR